MKQNLMQTNAIKQDPHFKMCLQSTLQATDADHFTKNISVTKKKKRFVSQRQTWCSAVGRAET